MLPCARSCTGKKIHPLPTTCIDVLVTGQPLLFLYPEWFQAAAQRRTFRSTRSKCQSDVITASRDKKSFSTSALAVNALVHNRSSLKGKQNKRCSDVRAKHDVSQPYRWKGSTRRYRPPTNLPEVDAEAIEDDKPVLRRRNSISRADGWEVVQMLARLCRSQLRQTKDHSRDRIQLPARLLVELVGTAGENMWLHREGSGCRVYVQPRTEKRSEYCDVLLEGSPRSREQARRYLRNKVIEFVANDQHDNKLEELDREIEVSAEPDKDSEVETKEIRVDALPTPLTWSFRSFWAYVQSITNHKLPRAIERTLYPGKQSYDIVAGQLLDDLFSDVRMAPFLSSVALKQALHFFRQRTQLARNAGNVWQSACEAGICPDIGCFNLELERSMIVRNFDRVRYLFYQATVYHVPPDIKTWCLVLTHLSLSRDRRETLNLLIKHHCIKTEFDRQELGKAIVQTDFKYVFKHRNGLEVFTETMQKTLGESWLSEPVLLEMIDQCFVADRLNELSDVLLMAHASNTRLTKQGSLRLLDAVRRTQNIQDMMIVLNTDVDHVDDLSKQTKFDLVFKAAWRHRMFNMCRLLWQSAASHGCITWPMQDLVLKSIANNEHNRVSKESMLAAITIGTNTESYNADDKYLLLKQYDQAENVMQHLVRWIPNDGVRHEQLQLVHDLLEQDLTAWKVYEPMAWSKFLKMLDEAYALDMIWKSSGRVEEMSFADIQREAINVELQRKPARSNRETGQHEDGLIMEDNHVNLEVAAEKAEIVLDSDMKMPQTSANRSSQSSDEQSARQAATYSAFSHEMSSIFFPSYTTMPAIVLSSSGIFDLILHQLRLAWETG